jgi:hypothetical protein
VNLEVLNGYVLAVVAIIAGCLYVAMIVAGYTELMSRLPKGGNRKKHSTKGSATRKGRNVKTSPHS